MQTLDARCPNHALIPTAEKVRRIASALEETNRFIEREESRNPSLRSDETVRLLAFWKSHREVLVTMLAELSVA